MTSGCKDTLAHMSETGVVVGQNVLAPIATKYFFGMMKISVFVRTVAYIIGSKTL
jgi:hypothetical protein